MVDVKPSPSPALARCLALGLTAAAMADATGCSATTCGAWLRGQKRPGYAARRALVSLGVDPALWESSTAPRPSGALSASAPAGGNVPAAASDESGPPDEHEVGNDRADLAHQLVRLEEIRGHLRTPHLGAREFAVYCDLEGRQQDRIARTRARIQLSERPDVTPAEVVHAQHVAVHRMLFAALRRDAEVRCDWRVHDLVRNALRAWPGEWPAAARERLTRFAELDAEAIREIVALVSEPTEAALDAANKATEGVSNA